MSKRDDLIAKYAQNLKEKCGVSPDMDLLTKVTIGCGPAFITRMHQPYRAQILPRLKPSSRIF